MFPEMVTKVLLLAVAIIHLAFAWIEFHGRDSLDFYHKFEIRLDAWDTYISDNEIHLAKAGAPFEVKNVPATGTIVSGVGRIVTNAALFNLLLATGLCCSLCVRGDVRWLQLYLLSTIIVAGIVGGLTLAWWVAPAQSGIALLAIIMVPKRADLNDQRNGAATNESS